MTSPSTKEIQNWIQAANPGKGDVEITSVRSEDRTFSWAEGKPDGDATSDSQGYSIRVLNEGRQGIIRFGDLSEPVLKGLVREASTVAEKLLPDPHRAMASPAESYPNPIAVDTDVFKSSRSEIMDRFAALEKTILKTDSRIKKVVRFQFGEERDHSLLVNSKGLVCNGEATSSYFMMEILAEEGSNKEVAWEGRTARFSKDLSWEDMADQVAKDVLFSLGAKPIPSGEYSVVITPRVVIQILSLMVNALSAEAVQMGRSFWKNHRGKKVGAPLVNLIDDPLLPEGVASSPFDDEGVPTRKMEVVKNGVLTDYFFDIRSANREGRESNGHGFRAGLGAPSSPRPTNFWLVPGTTPLSEMLSSDPVVFQLKEVMGLHMADPITGEFSLGATGDLYKNGKRVQGVRGVTVAGQVPEILKKAGGVGNDFVRFGSMGAPSILVSKMMISGSE